MEKELIVEIEELSNLGSGVAKIDGMVIFVENACPKDKLRVKVTKKTKNYLNAEIVEIVLHVALNTLTNYINEVAQTEIDFPKVDLKIAV